VNTTVIYALIAVLALGFVVGGIAVWQVNKEAPLPAVGFSSPFRADEGAGGLNNEYISVRNNGESPVDLSGWVLSNGAGYTFIFPEGSILAAGSVVTIYSGCAEDAKEARGLYWCATKPVWHDVAGKATLYMPNSTVVDTHAYAYACLTCTSSP
jgi:hypothetical protein